MDAHLNEAPEESAFARSGAAAPRTRAVAWLCAALLLCVAIGTVRAQGGVASQRYSDGLDAQLQYQESRVDAWHAAQAADAARRAAETRAIVRAQREYQNSRSLAWWRARPNVYVGELCTEQKVAEVHRADAR